MESTKPRLTLRERALLALQERRVTELEDISYNLGCPEDAIRRGCGPVRTLIAARANGAGDAAARLAVELNGR